MRKIFIILAVVLLGAGAQAQQIKAYMAGGFTASQIEGDELKGFDKWGGMFGVGATASLTSDNRWKLGVETDIVSRGAKNMTGNPYSVRIPLKYVDIPVTFYYHDPKGGMTIGAGLTYGRLVQQPHDSVAFGPAFIPDTVALKGFNTNDFLFTIEARFQVWQWIFFSLRYQRSIMPINRMTFMEDAVGSEYDSYTNNCYNSSIQGRVIIQFGDPNEDYRGHKHGKKKSHRRRW